MARRERAILSITPGSKELAKAGWRSWAEHTNRQNKHPRKNLKCNVPVHQRGVVGQSPVALRSSMLYRWGWLRVVHIHIRGAAIVLIAVGSCQRQGRYQERRGC